MALNVPGIVKWIIMWYWPRAKPKKILNGQLADLKGEYNGNLNNSLIITQEGFGKYGFIDNIHKKYLKLMLENLPSNLF